MVEDFMLAIPIIDITNRIINAITNVAPFCPDFEEIDTALALKGFLKTAHFDFID